jgi:hypothetical protein
MDFYSDALARGAIVETPEEIELKKRSLLPRARAVSVGGTVTNTVQPGEENIRKALDMYAQEDDYSQAQAYARTRADEGGASMLNALAAQYAGPRFEGVQGQYLKRSMAAREPMKIGSAMITPDGQVLKDPSASREREAQRLMQLGQFQISQDDKRQAREDNAVLRMSLAGMRGNSNADDARNWRAEDKLRNDFDKVTGDLQTELGATRKITEIISATPPGSRPDAITQQSLVILLNKFLDPGSVVREGEFDRVIKAQGLEGRARNLINNIMKGEPLNDVAIQQINNLAQLYQRAAEAKLMATAQQYSQLAQTRGLDPAGVIVNPAYRGGEQPGSNRRVRFEDLANGR